MNWETLAKTHERLAARAHQAGDHRATWWQWILAADAWLRAARASAGVARARCLHAHRDAVRLSSVAADRYADTVDLLVHGPVSPVGGDA